VAEHAVRCLLTDAEILPRRILGSFVSKGEEKLVVFGYRRERLYTRERAKALARGITCELLTESLTILLVAAIFQLVGLSHKRA
jgi:hypothetical protein